MHRHNEIPIGLSFSCSGQLPLIASFEKHHGQISGRYLATGGKADNGLAWRRWGEATRKTKNHCPPFLNYPYSVQNNTEAKDWHEYQLVLEAWSWKFNDITSECGPSMSESALGRASNVVLIADTIRLMTNPMENCWGGRYGPTLVNDELYAGICRDGVNRLLIFTRLYAVWCDAELMLMSPLDPVLASSGLSISLFTRHKHVIRLKFIFNFHSDNLVLWTWVRGWIC